MFFSSWEKKKNLLHTIILLFLLMAIQGRFTEYESCIFTSWEISRKLLCLYDY